MKKIITRMMAFVMMLALIPTNVFAAESVSQVHTNVEEKSTEVKEIEQIDPNIIVVVTKIKDDGNFIAPYHVVGTYTTFDFHGTLTGKYRKYHGNHFSVDIKTSSDKNGNFELKLQKEGALGVGTTVAKAQLPQNGSFHVEFLNVNDPNKNYRFRFEQCGIVVNAHQTGEMDIWDWD